METIVSINKNQLLEFEHDMLFRIEVGVAEFVNNIVQNDVIFVFSLLFF